jgi:hypothetical protein
LSTTSVDDRQWTVAKELYSLVGFTPTGTEQEAVLHSGKRFILVSGGDQAGKSLIASKYLLRRYPEKDGAALYWLVGSDYEKTRSEFEYLMDDFAKLGWLKRSSKRIDPGYIELMDGTRIETKSAKDPRSLVMRSPDGVIMCEAAQMELSVYNRLQSRVAASRGWIFMCGTLEGSLGWYPSLLNSWIGGYGDEQSFRIPSWTNTSRFPGGRSDPEIVRLEQQSSDGFFMERIAGIASPPAGLVFNEFRPDIHIQDIKYEPGYPIYLWEDPGYGSHSAHAVEVAQEIGGQFRVFDEIYEQGLITQDIIHIARSREWWKEEVKYLVSDPHYKDAHHSQTSVAETWLAQTGLHAGGERGRIMAGVERMKSFLKPDPLSHIPQIVFSPHCVGVLSEFGSSPCPLPSHLGETQVYRWRTDKDGHSIGDTPEDRNNHGIKACTYGIVAKYGYARSTFRQTIRVKRWNSNEELRKTRRIRSK